MRSATIIPQGAWQTPGLLFLSPLSVALWQSLWLAVADAGQYPAHPEFLRRALAVGTQASDADLAQAAEALIAAGLVRSYRAGGMDFLWHVGYAEANLSQWRAQGRDPYPLPPWVGIETDPARSRLRYVMRDGEERAPAVRVVRSQAPARAPEKPAVPVPGPVGGPVPGPVGGPVPGPVGGPVLARASTSSSSVSGGDSLSASPRGEDETTAARARARDGPTDSAGEDQAEALSRPAAGVSAAAYVEAVERAIGRRVYPAGAAALVRAGVTPAMAADLARIAEARAPGRMRNLAYLVAVGDEPAARARDRPERALRDILAGLGGGLHPA